MEWEGGGSDRGGCKEDPCRGGGCTAGDERTLGSPGTRLTSKDHNSIQAVFALH